MTRVTFCVPIFRGAAFLPELCASLRAQTLRDFAVVLSVDGDEDTESLAAAQALTHDSRFTARINLPRAGWSGHLDILLRSVTTEFACYMPQDDVVEPGYLAALLAAVDAAPVPSSAFTDIRYFGSQDHVETNDGVPGSTALTRAMHALAHQPWIPIRSLMPRALAAGAVAPTTPEQIAEDHVTTLRMALFGPVLRVRAPLYRKRVHGANTGGRWLRWDAARRRAAWAELGARMLEAALPAARDPGEARLLWRALCMRHCLPKPGRQEFWIPEDRPDAVVVFARDLLAAFAARGHDVAALFGADADVLALEVLVRRLRIKAAQAA